MTACPATDIRQVRRETEGVCWERSKRSSSLECPVSLSSWGVPSPNEHLENFTCRYLSFLDEKLVNTEFYETRELAVQAVMDGHAWGVVAMDHNFTTNLYGRIFESLTNEDLRYMQTNIFSITLNFTF